MERLGIRVSVPARARPVPDRSTPLYVALTILTFGIFSMYWRYATMKDGNGHFDDDASLEDALVGALGAGPGVGAGSAAL